MPTDTPGRSALRALPVGRRTTLGKRPIDCEMSTANLGSRANCPPEHVHPPQLPDESA
jgi:hypothetical protein